jgi:hypothetical protein
MSVEITHEPTPAPLATGKSRFIGGIHVRFIDSTTGKQVGENISENMKIWENERRTRESRKY